MGRSPRCGRPIRVSAAEKYDACRAVSRFHQRVEKDAAVPVNFGSGWDSVATLVDGRWVDRRPRRVEDAGRLRMETQLMPWLAARLPLAVPEPRIAAVEPLVVRHALVAGEPIDTLSADNGFVLGRFLRALHAVDLAAAVAHGLPTARETARDRDETVARFRSEVTPLLPAPHRAAATNLLDAIGGLPADTVVHGDVGPEHVLCTDERLTGVIDFSDAHAGDPAIDLAWVLHATPHEFSCAAARAYGVTRHLRERAFRWHQLGPWYEVLHGLDHDEPAEVRSGLDGVLRRLTGVQFRCAP